MDGSTSDTLPRRRNSADGNLLPAILELWHEVLPSYGTGLEPDTHFFLAGGDSLDLARLLQRIRQRFGLTLHLHEADAFSTPARMSALCEQRLAAYKTVPQRAAVVSLEDRYPASAMQQGLWFESQCAGGREPYNTAVALHLNGSLDVMRMQATLHLLLRQHPVLRSRFVLASARGGLVVRIAPMAMFELAVIETASKELAAMLASAASRPFDLARQNPCRFHLYRVDHNPHHHVLLLCLHHCVTDGWSGNVLLQSLASIWNVLCDGRDGTPAPVDTGQAAYCRAEAAGRRQAEYQDALVWWQNQAAEIKRCDDWLGHVACRPRPFRLARETLLFGAADLQPAMQCAQTAGVSSCTRLLAAFRLALLELTGSANCLIGMPVSCRQCVLPDAASLEQSAGCFVNLVLSHDRVSQAEDAGRLLQRLHQRHLQVLSRAGVPFADVASAIALTKRPGGNIALDILFAFQNSPARIVAFRGLVHSVREIPPQWGQFPLALSVSASAGAYQCTLDYAADICSSAWARMLLVTCKKKYHWLCEGERSDYAINRS